MSEDVVFGVREAGTKREIAGIVGGLLLIPLLLYLPLVASLAEHLFFQTQYVYEFCDGIGIADHLEVIYMPVIEVIEGYL